MTVMEASELEQGWCPSCRQWTVFDPGQDCGWCDTTVVRRKRRSTAPVGAPSRLSRDHVVVLYRAHMEGFSLAELGRRIWKPLGYASPDAARIGIAKAFATWGFEQRGGTSERDRN